jgi:hypothetical protein
MQEIINTAKQPTDDEDAPLLTLLRAIDARARLPIVIIAYTPAALVDDVLGPVANSTAGDIERLILDMR